MVGGERVKRSAWEIKGGMLENICVRLRGQNLERHMRQVCHNLGFCDRAMKA